MYRLTIFFPTTSRIIEHEKYWHCMLVGVVAVLHENAECFTIRSEKNNDLVFDSLTVKEDA